MVTHKVVPGESWESISLDFYGSSSNSGALARFNGMDPSDPPRAGTGIRVPLSAGDLDRLDARLDAAAVYNEGLDLAASGDFASAIKRFQAALEEDPQFLDASFNLAVTYQKLGLHSDAEAVLEDLVAGAPGNADYCFALGSARFYQKEYDKAAKAFRMALDADPYHLKSTYSLAMSYERMGEESKASRMWRRYLELDPDSEWADEARAHLADPEKDR
jgi:tetratricopeptide (TPR) repeat protein